MTQIGVSWIKEVMEYKFQKIETFDDVVYLSSKKQNYGWKCS